jgi:hypothetical protein
MLEGRCLHDLVREGISREPTHGPVRVADRHPREEDAVVDTDPVIHTYTLGCGVEEAFDAYTRRIGEWWHPTYTADPDTLETVVIEPRRGGRVFARHAGEGELEWGEVTEWDPPAASPTPSRARSRPNIRAR